MIIATCTTAMILNVRSLRHKLLCTDFRSVKVAGVTTVAVSCPTMAMDLNIKDSQMQWIMSAYSLGAVGRFIARLYFLADDLPGLLLHFLRSLGRSVWTKEYIRGRTIRPWYFHPGL